MHPEIIKGQLNYLHAKLGNCQKERQNTYVDNNDAKKCEWESIIYKRIESLVMMDNIEDRYTIGKALQ